MMLKYMFEVLLVVNLLLFFNKLKFMCILIKNKINCNGLIIVFYVLIEFVVDFLLFL